jgi:hypothetical protein
MKTLGALLVITLLSGCSLPQTTVRSGSSQPGLIVRDAPSGSTLFVDGLAIGPANEFDGNPKVLTVLEGIHKVEVRSGATVIFSEKTFASNGETHTVTVVGGGTQ